MASWMHSKLSLKQNLCVDSSAAGELASQPDDFHFTDYHQKIMVATAMRLMGQYDGDDEKEIAKDRRRKTNGWLCMARPKPKAGL